MGARPGWLVQRPIDRAVHLILDNVLNRPAGAGVGRHFEHTPRTGGTPSARSLLRVHVSDAQTYGVTVGVSTANQCAGE